jgi:ribosome-associated protein
MEQLSNKALAHRAAELCLAKKGEDVMILDLRGLSSVTDFFVIASASSNVHVKAVADFVQSELLKIEVKPKVKPWHVEGADTQRWMLLDFVNVVVHVFRTETREYYSLERLWGDAPIEEITDEGTAGS